MSPNCSLRPFTSGHIPASIINQALNSGGLAALRQALGEDQYRSGCALDSRFVVMYIVRAANDPTDRFVRVSYRWDHPHLLVNGQRYTDGYFRQLPLKRGVSGLVPAIWQLTLSQRIDGPFRYRVFQGDRPLLDISWIVEGCPR